MRRRLFGILGAVAVVCLLAAPVSAAAPLENGWDTFTGSVFDSCTGEVVDNSGKVHTVLTESISHNNVHLVGIGETSGVAYVGSNTINAPVHVAADGSYTADLRVHVSLVSMGSSPNAQTTIRLHQVFDADGNLISETSDLSSDCRGS